MVLVGVDLVLILIVLEDGLGGEATPTGAQNPCAVLILVVLEYGLGEETLHICRLLSLIVLILIVLEKYCLGEVRGYFKADNYSLS